MHGSAVCKQLASYSLIRIIVFPVAKNKNLHSYAAMLYCILISDYTSPPLVSFLVDCIYSWYYIIRYILSCD